jgi:hypothetical protein
VSWEKKYNDPDISHFDRWQRTSNRVIEKQNLSVGSTLLVSLKD